MAGKIMRLAAPAGFFPVIAIAALLGVAAAFATVVGDEDGRGTLTEKAAELGLSRAEVGQIKNTTGFVVCPGKKHNNPAVGSGVLIRSNRILVTAAHVIVDSETGKLRGPLGDCYFATNQPHKTKVELYKFEVSTNSIYLGHTKRTNDNLGRDFAVIRLARPVADASPYIMMGLGQTGSEILVVSAVQPDVSKDSSQPIVQKCSIKGRNQHQLWVTDCDAVPLASGGPALFYTGFEYAFEGVLVNTGKASLKGKPFDPATGSFTIITPADKMVPAIKAMLEGRELPVDNAYKGER